MIRTLGSMPCRANAGAATQSPMHAVLNTRTNADRSGISSRPGSAVATRRTNACSVPTRQIRDASGRVDVTRPSNPNTSAPKWRAKTTIVRKLCAAAKAGRSAHEWPFETARPVHPIKKGCTQPLRQGRCCSQARPATMSLQAHPF